MFYYSLYIYIYSIGCCCSLLGISSLLYRDLCSFLGICFGVQGVSLQHLPKNAIKLAFLLGRDSNMQLWAYCSFLRWPLRGLGGRAAASATWAEPLRRVFFFF